MGVEPVVPVIVLYTYMRAQEFSRFISCDQTDLKATAAGDGEPLKSWDNLCI